MGTSRWVLGAVAFLAAYYLPAAVTAAPVNIGVAAAVKNDVHGLVGGSAQTISVGSSIYQDQVVETGADAMAQLLFLDQTSLSIGPKSQIKLDRFVFDPQRKQGDVVLEASRGAFRFITGSQDPTSYTLKTPVATIGVRGTIVDFFVQDDNLILILDEGRAFITMADGTVIELTNPGDYILVKSDGTVIGPKSWNGSIDTVIKDTSFPLYGHRFAEVPWSNDVRSSDDYSNLTDELASHFITSVIDDGDGGSTVVTTGGGNFGGSGGHPNNGCGNGGSDGVPGGSGHGDGC